MTAPEVHLPVNPNTGCVRVDAGDHYLNLLPDPDATFFSFLPDPDNLQATDLVRMEQLLFIGPIVMPVYFDGKAFSGVPCDGIFPLGPLSDVWQLWNYTIFTPYYMTLAQNTKLASSTLRSLESGGGQMTWVTATGSVLDVTIDVDDAALALPPGDTPVFTNFVQIVQPYVRQVFAGYDAWPVSSMPGTTHIGRAALPDYQWLVSGDTGRVYVEPNAFVDINQVRLYYFNVSVMVVSVFVAGWIFYKMAVSSNNEPFATRRHGLIGEQLHKTMLAVSVILTVVAVHAILTLYWLAWPALVCQLDGLCWTPTAYLLAWWLPGLVLMAVNYVSFGIERGVTPFYWAVERQVFFALFLVATPLQNTSYEFVTWNVVVIVWIWTLGLEVLKMVFPWRMDTLPTYWLTTLLYLLDVCLLLTVCATCTVRRTVTWRQYEYSLFFGYIFIFLCFPLITIYRWQVTHNSGLLYRARRYAYQRYGDLF